MTRLLRCGILCFSIFCLHLTVFSQWYEQSVTLQPGWNAVHLYVQPSPNAGDDVFAGLPVESVWMWNKRFVSVQFLADPDELSPTDPDWLVYFPPASPQAAAKSLNIILGGRSYLIRLGGAQAVAKKFVGRPVVRQREWLTNSFNFVGFSLDPDNLPSFSNFFAGSPAHQKPNSFFRLNNVGAWTPLNLSSAMKDGEAFWVFSQGGSNFSGPVVLQSLASSGLDFDRLANKLSFDLKNTTTQLQQVSLRLIASKSPPPGEPSLAGGVPLTFLDTSNTSGGLNGTWNNFNEGDIINVQIPAKQTLQVSFGIRRADLPPVAPDADTAFQSVLEVNDQGGQRQLVPVAARSSVQPANILAARQRNVGARSKTEGVPAANPFSGLWVGYVTVQQVSTPTNVLDRLALKPASGNFSFRLILHVDDTGLVRLLQQVIAMTQDGPDGPEVVLVTDDALIPEFDGLIMRNGVLVGQRLSSAVFPFFNEPGQPKFTVAAAGGTFENGDFNTTETLLINFSVPFDDPTNPFVHQYHPDHDNLNFSFGPWHPDVVDGKESWTIDREITLQFSPYDFEFNTNPPPPDYLATRVTGLYQEKLYGLYRTDVNRDPEIRTPLVVGGIFTLRRMFTVDELNGGITP